MPVVCTLMIQATMLCSPSSTQEAPGGVLGAGGALSRHPVSLRDLCMGLAAEQVGFDVMLRMLAVSESNQPSKAAASPLEPQNLHTTVK